MAKPEVICLMMTSADGKILSAKWGDDPRVKRLLDNFEKAHETFEVPAWICGRTTMEKDFTHGARPVIREGAQHIERTDFIGDSNATSFAVAIDGHGKLGWPENSLHGDHVITVLTETVPDGYLAGLQEAGVSYIFAGETALNLEVALQKLHALFGIKKLMLEGGGYLNGSFMNAGLIDEVNLLILPIVDGTARTSTAFDVEDAVKKDGATVMSLKEVRQIEQDVVWLKYAVVGKR